MLRERARFFAVYGLVAGGAAAAVLYAVGTLVVGVPIGIVALLVAMVGVFTAILGYGGSSDASTVTAAERARGGDPEAIAWCGITGELQALAFVGVGVALYGLLGIALVTVVR